MERAMAPLVVHASYVLTPHEAIPDGVVVVEDGKITAAGHRDEVQVPAGAEDCVANGMSLTPGFVDVHIHGAGGHDVMEATPEALHEVAAMVARYGTTSLVATTVTAPPDETCRSLEGIAAYIRNGQALERHARPAAEILGIHFEGPFISHVRRGVHPEDAIAPPSVELMERFLAAADGCAKILTLAPELPGALELVEAAAKAGLIVALGHTDASYEQARAAIDRGARHAVHVFNAMRPFSHRETGVLGAIFTEPELTAEIIADGVHVDGPAIKLLLAAKGPGQVLAVSDGTAATGMPDGRYRLGNMEVEVSGGVCRNFEGKLAGSTLTLDRALRNLISLGVPSLEALRMVTLYPARRLGLAGKKGAIAPGADADLVVLTPELQVAGVLTRGVGLE
jgi:N-acetylglucosamine-6-phosphate deacetylase